MAAVASAWVMERQVVAGVLCYLVTNAFIGTRFRALGNMMHEASHNFLTRSARLNSILGHLLAYVDFNSFSEYRSVHMTHHKYVGDRERDLDFRSRLRFGFQHAQLSFLRFHVLRPLTLFHVPLTFRPRLWSRREGAFVIAGRVLFCASLLLLLGIIGLNAFVLYYALPFLTSYQIICYWSDAFDHAGVFGAEDEFCRARNHLMRSKVGLLLLLPRNDQYHLVHHLFPGIPTAQQRVMHDLLMREDEDYSVRNHSWLSPFQADPTAEKERQGSSPLVATASSSQCHR